MKYLNKDIVMPLCVTISMLTIAWLTPNSLFGQACTIGAGLNFVAVLISVAAYATAED